MRSLSCALFFFSTVFIAGQSIAMAATSCPDGNITFYNASHNQITAQVSTYGKFELQANERKDVPYSTLVEACGVPANCRAQFYVNDVPAGSATLNVTTGKLVNMQLSMKVHTAKEGPEQVLRSVVIQ